ncbi:MAG: CDP-glycerol glycerophosphotransferase family protein [Methanobrevibacter sp.]|uniref:CDP-glycerol glycerophosphotransferase family protein n=1 Tax=Methanobrevibacter sp. TaxID=66852 RepID=UPI0026E0F5A0|nr:CDP-glycerol glycerophosphotransferase family protein [Methanobrevibacter sp.]MDO5848647.1 CDP-glycerol glycerophosphotransferase family protein [Methanobrevibacter sp.]
MSFKHKIFGFIFNSVSSSNIDENLVSFIIDDNKSFISNFKHVEDEFKKRGDFEFFFYNKNRLSIKDLKTLSKSKYVFLNDNFLAMANMKFNEGTVITQLWHAPGAFKKFGASSSNNKKEIELIKKSNENITYLINTSKNIADFYQEAFQIDKSKIKSLGIPRMDYYFKKHDDLREKFDNRFPQAKGKKIVLYAPTFRDNEYNNDVFNFFDLDEFNDRLGEDYVLALRLHPKIKKFYEGMIGSDENLINVSGVENEQELLMISDLLISDYSSMAVEFAALDKPVILFAYDLDNYLSNERGFYFDFDEMSPGKVVKTSDELIGCIESKDFKINNSKFLENQFDRIDGKSSERIVDLLLK